jgi:hypothetical protein
LFNGTYCHLVIVPAYEFHEVVVERNTGSSIEDGGVRIAVQIGGNNSILGVGEYA